VILSGLCHLLDPERWQPLDVQLEVSPVLDDGVTGELLEEILVEETDVLIAAGEERGGVLGDLRIASGLRRGRRWEGCRREREWLGGADDVCCCMGGIARTGWRHGVLMAGFVVGMRGRLDGGCDRARLLLGEGWTVRERRIGASGQWRSNYRRQLSTVV
jgi:hypothetical protein